MNADGRYPSFFNPENRKKTGDLEPHLNPKEEWWKKHKNEKAIEDYFRGQDHNRKKKNEEPETSVPPEEKYEKPPEDHEYQSEYNITYLDELDKAIQRIEDVTLREKVVEYNQTKGVINWVKAAALTKYDLLSKTKDAVIKKTAEGVAIATTKIVGNSTAVAVGVTTVYGLADLGLISAITAMTFGKESPDDFNKNLTIILDTILPWLLRDLTKQGCNNSIPQILKHIIHPTTVTKLREVIQETSSQYEHFGQLVDHSTDFCNKIVPIISSFFKKNGFSKGIGPEANTLLVDYLNVSLSLTKDIVWDIFQINIKQFADDVESAIERGDVYTDKLSVKYQFDNMFETMATKFVITDVQQIAQRSYAFLYENRGDIEPQIEQILDHPIPPLIQVEETKLKENLVEFTQDKVKIGDFINTLIPSIQKLLALWYDEICKQSGRKDFSSVDCLLNVLDLRINTLLDETCTIYAKGFMTEVLCSEKFIGIVSEFVTKPIEDIHMDDVKEAFKNIIIHLTIQKIKGYYDFVSNFFIFDQAILTKPTPRPPFNKYHPIPRPPLIASYVK
jgi:hypothetical protein